MERSRWGPLKLYLSTYFGRAGSSLLRGLCLAAVSRGYSQGGSARASPCVALCCWAQALGPAGSVAVAPRV